MLKLDWHEPNFIAQRNFSIASDTSTANLYILRKKYIDKFISVDWNSFDGDSEYVYKREDTYIDAEPAAMLFFSAVNPQCLVVYVAHAIPKFNMFFVSIDCNRHFLSVFF